MIKEIKTKIGFSRLPVTDIFSDISKRKEYAKLIDFTLIENSMKNGMSFYSAFEKNINENRNLSYLKDDDKALIISFISGLGASDTNGQADNCSTYIELIGDRISALENDSRNCVKLCNSIGALSGFLIFVIFY